MGWAATGLKLWISRKDYDHPSDRPDVSPMAKPPSKTLLHQEPCPHIELHHRSEILRFQLTNPEHRLGRDPTWADLSIPDLPQWSVVSSRHALLRKESQGYRLIDGDGQRRSTNGLFYQKTCVDLDQGLMLTEPMELEIGQDPQNLIRLHYIPADPLQPDPPPQPGQRRLDFNQMPAWPIILGRDPGPGYNTFALDSATVSRHHADIDRTGAGLYILRDRGSTNGTYVNDQKINGPHTLNQGDKIKIGPFVLVYYNHSLELVDQGERIRLDAQNLQRRITIAQQERMILTNVSIVIEPRQLVAIVGGSGTGKSTLMGALLGIVPLTSGLVLLNGSNLQQNFDTYRAEIGYVPQEDIIHSGLTVEEVLRYACKLRLPPDTQPQEIQGVIGRVLEQVKLTAVKGNLVAQLSGGQRKRVSIAVELLANPKLFFLDEPTSGLDPGLDKELMGLLRNLANQGRTIVLVTHATSNIEGCDRLVFMGRGGRLCYFGPPAEAMPFFNLPDRDWKYFADIYLTLEQGTTEAERQRTAFDWSERFRASHLYQTYIGDRLSMGNQGESTATFAAVSSEARAMPPQGKDRSLGLRPHVWHQLLTLCQRQWQLLRRDRLSLAVNLLSAPLAILFIVLALDSQPFAPQENTDLMQAPQALRVLFVFTCAGLWVGLASSAQTIIRETHIYGRERLANLSVFAYLGSKIGVASGVAIVQSLMITLAVMVGFSFPAPSLIPWPLGVMITTFLTLLASISLGLFISSAVKNVDQASKVLPPILLPQIIFSGVLFKLSGPVAILSWLMIGRWSVGAYGSLVNVNALVPEQPDFALYEPPPLPFDPSPVYDPTWGNLFLNWGLLLIHTLVYLSLTLIQQWRKEQK
ncbi:ATP-binding cassette domain-containing protein [Candidatus Synechococcus calcipolaris G9]|uniref:ATP-binding cassette domain-containing protein n=1 Tax=Candidatus Synechococcus calcipolaris G9 TaxID=1497997 RepID=A0ABT6EWS3_9SYNE|nr:ATP-binding cassette domain-containing protein [Candidatus Synechococcus calcipolaris]MDG2989360.1 ATP-binding cassette domain-containing protein [Candidatus Synechococcus calcipolaris G9]